ncbi:hypothetical protein ACFWIB_04325 [Streptomyces sp. NPDC127051]|uniref:hypothetical protein n=1 Tax=Streptomyces sp. NPDC127051 TaxID=3347119 RepID=UPI003669AFF3
MKPTAHLPEITSPPFDPGEIAALWAAARSLFYAQNFPPYASRAWCALSPDDPRRIASALDAAERWRKYGDEQALLQWFRETFVRRPSLAERKTVAELAAARQPKPPHQLQATPGWPPIAIPGQPGRWLTHRQEMAA